MDTHVKTLGLFNMIFGAVSLVAFSAFLFSAGGFAGVYSAFNEDIYGVIAVVSTIFHLGVAIPCIIAGYFVRQLKDWARVFLILTSAINILNAPFGTLLGAYGLWVLLLPETEPLFQNAPAQMNRRAKRQAGSGGTLASAAKDEGSNRSILPSTPSTSPKS
jgi:fructose-specific phosphotransferase system IIC component